MANGQENLIPMSERSKEEVRELGKKGGIASGETRREKATMKKTLEMLLESTNDMGKTYRELSTLGLIKGAMEGKADNYKTMLALLGELQESTISETPNVQINIVDNSKLEKTLYESDN